MLDLVIRGGTILDGSGGEPLVGDVAITDGRIVSVGPRVREPARRTLDADGRNAPCGEQLGRPLGPLGRHVPQLGGVAEQVVQRHAAVGLTDELLAAVHHRREEAVLQGVGSPAEIGAAVADLSRRLRRFTPGHMTT